MIVEKCEKTENRQVRLTIRIEKDVWQEALGRCYEENKSSYPVEGAAPGTAAREDLIRTYGAGVLFQEGVNAVFPQALVDAVNQEKIEIVGTPELQVKTVSEDGFEFTAVIDLSPEVKLGTYKGLKAAYPASEVTEEETDAAMEHFRRAHMSTADADRAAMGDEVVLDFEGFLDGTPFEGGKAEKYPLVLGSGAFIPGFEEQLVGICVNEARDVNVTFPQEYTPDLAGKAVVFKVKAHGIRRHVMPELNDAFAQTQGFEDRKALRAAVKEKVQQNKDNQCLEAYADALIRQVMDSMETEVPASMVDSHIQNMICDLERRLADQGKQLEDYLQATGNSRQDLENLARGEAEKSARFELAMLEIARREDITVSDGELADQYRDMSERYGMSVPQIQEQIPPARLIHDIRIARARDIVIDSGIRI